jgi:Flp pilus assembly protein TadD
MPDDDEAHHILGLTLMDDEPLEAIAHVQRAHEIDPKLPHVLREWGRTLWPAKRLDEAIDKLRDALALDPGDAFGHSYMGAVLLEAGELLEAKRYLTRALELDPDDEMARHALADLER